MKHSLVRSIGGVAIAVTLGLSFAPAASAQSGLSTPGVTVTAVNPGSTGTGSTMKLTLTAHTERSTVPDPSCRPEDLTLRCWGSLVLRVPDEGGFSVTGFQVHRVAVGDISCGDENGGCGDVAAVASGSQQPLKAQVNGVALVTDPGSLASEGVAAGTEVQLKMTLTDNGTGQGEDTIDLVVNAFQSGSDKPQLFETVATIQQVQIHLHGA